MRGEETCPPESPAGASASAARLKAAKPELSSVTPGPMDGQELVDCQPPWPERRRGDDFEETREAPETRGEQKFGKKG